MVGKFSEEADVVELNIKRDLVEGFWIVLGEGLWVGVEDIGQVV